jgi:hypothetical protein
MLYFCLVPSQHRSLGSLLMKVLLSTINPSVRASTCLSNPSLVMMSTAIRNLQNVSCVYEALGLGKHRAAGQDLVGSLVTYEGAGAGTAWLQGMVAGCADFAPLALQAAKDQRWIPRNQRAYCYLSCKSHVLSYCLQVPAGLWAA